MSAAMLLNDLRFEPFEEIGRQRRVDVVGYAQDSGEGAETNAPCGLRQRDQLGNGLAGFGDDDLLAGCCAVDEARKVGLRLAHVDGRHGLKVVWPTFGVKVAEQIDTVLSAERRAAGSAIERLEGSALAASLEDEVRAGLLGEAG
ncbi:MAG: hypothetical protein WAJ85_09170 [Candidatus Baltobacteraceae bacterium]|jgi:hypothetical protein